MSLSCVTGHRFGADAMMYGLALRQGYRSCEAGAIKELTEMRRLVRASHL